MRHFRHPAGHSRRWAAGDGVAAGSGAAAALIGMTGAPAARADTPIDPVELLDAAATDMTQAEDVLSKLPDTVVVNVGGDPADVIDQFEAIQEPLFSSHNGFLTGLAGLLFDGPDQHLADAGGAVLAAAQAVAADPSSTTADPALISATLQYGDAVLVDSLLPNAAGKVIDQLFGLGNGTDADPLAQLSSASGDLTQVGDLLSHATVPADLQSFLETAQQFPTSSLSVVDQAETAQAPLLSADDPFSSLAGSLFSGLDQQLAQDSAAVLTATQAFAADPSAATEDALLGSSLQLDGPEVESLFPTIGAGLVDHLFGLGGADVAGAVSTDLAGATAADLASGIDPGVLFGF